MCITPDCPNPSRTPSGKTTCHKCYHRSRVAKDPEAHERRLAKRREDYASKLGRPVYVPLTKEERKSRAIMADRRFRGAPAIPDRKSGEREICKKYADPLCLDHDHETGRLRGWLCRQCNTGLGYFKDSVDFLHSAISYLTRQ